MHNPHFIKLLEILEERMWQYEIQQDNFYIIIGNREFEFYKYDKQKTLELIDIVNAW